MYWPWLLGRTSTGGILGSNVNDATTALSSLSRGSNYSKWQFFTFCCEDRWDTRSLVQIAQTCNKRLKWMEFCLYRAVLELRDSGWSVFCELKTVWRGYLPQVVDVLGKALEPFNLKAIPALCRRRSTCHICSICSWVTLKRRIYRPDK